MNFRKTLFAMSSALLLSGTSSAVFAQETVRFVHSTESVVFAPLFAAVAMGYFEESGLTPEVIRTGSGSTIVSAVVGGGADVAVVGSNELLTTRGAGVDLMGLAALVGQYSTTMVYSKAWAEKHGITEESPLEQRLAAMKGIKIATSGPGSADYLIRYFAGLGGFDPDRDLTIVHMGSDMSAYIAAVDSGNIDGFAMAAPVPQLAKKELGAILPFNTAAGEIELLDGYPHMLAISTSDFLKNKPELAAKVAEGFQRAVIAMRDPATTEQVREKVYEKYYPNLDKDLFNEVWEGVRMMTPDTIEIEREKLAKVPDFMNRFLENKIDVNSIDAAYTNEFAKAAVEKLK